MVSSTTEASGWATIAMAWFTALVMSFLLLHFFWLLSLAERAEQQESSGKHNSEDNDKSSAKSDTVCVGLFLTNQRLHETMQWIDSRVMRGLKLFPNPAHLKRYMKNRSKMAYLLLGLSIIFENLVMRTIECCLLLLRVPEFQIKPVRRTIWILVSIGHSFFSAVLLVRCWRLFVRFKYYVQLKNVGWITLISKLDVAGLDDEGGILDDLSVFTILSQTKSSAMTLDHSVSTTAGNVGGRRVSSHLSDTFTNPLTASNNGVNGGSIGTDVVSHPAHSHPSPLDNTLIPHPQLTFKNSDSVSTSLFGSTSSATAEAARTTADRNSFWLKYKTVLTSEKSMVLTCCLLTCITAGFAAATWQSFTLTRLALALTMLTFPILAFYFIYSLPKTETYQKYEMKAMLATTFSGWIIYTAWNMIIGSRRRVATGLFGENLALWHYFLAFCIAFVIVPKQYSRYTKVNDKKPLFRRQGSRGSSIMDIYRAMFEEFEAADKLSGFLAYSLGVFSAENVLALLECLEWKRKLRKEIERDASEAADSGLSLLSKVLKPYELPNRAVYNWDLHCSTVSLRKLGARSAIVSSKKLSFLSKARLLHRKYLSIDSPLQANVSHRVRDSIERVFLWFDQIPSKERRSIDSRCALLFIFDTAMSEIIDNVYETFSMFGESQEF